MVILQRLVRLSNVLLILQILTVRLQRSIGASNRALTGLAILSPGHRTCSIARTVSFLRIVQLQIAPLLLHFIILRETSNAYSLRVTIEETIAMQRKQQQYSILLQLLFN